MDTKINTLHLTGWVIGLLVFTVGLLNLFLVHPVPAIGYFLLSLIYLPPANAYLKRRFGISIPAGVKIILFLVIVMFTLGVSDLGDMID